MGAPLPIPVSKKGASYTQGVSNGKEKPIYCEETDTVYPSASTLAAALGITRAAIYHCCNGRSTKVYVKNANNTKTLYHLRWAE